MSPARETIITAEEFEALPASIQKKYFSPLERLRINQQHLLDERKKRMHKPSWRTPPSVVENNRRPATSQGLRRSSNATETSTQSLPLIAADQKHISDEQARWFLTLPEKIRRQQFSRQEQITLMIRCKQALEFTDPELASDAYQRCSSDPKDRSRLSLITKHRPSTSTGVSFDGTQSFLDIDAASVRTTETSNAEMKIFKLYSRRNTSEVAEKVEVNDDAPVSLPPELVNIPEPPRTLRKRPTFRRLSLTPLPLPPPTLAPPMPLLPQLAPESRRASIRSNSMSAALSARLSRPYMDMLSPAELPTSEPTSPSRPYHDVDIRKQLRRTLLSPEKFDEALEFGFETDESPKASPSKELSFPFQDFPDPTSDGEDSDPTTTFIDTDDGLADVEENDDDTISVDTASPRTPTPVTVDVRRSSNGKTPSVDSAIEMPYQTSPTRPTGGLADSVGSPREWTLHMTLTRPDLAYPSPPSSTNSGGTGEALYIGKRSAEEVLYSVQRQQTSGVGVETQDPLALAKLDVCEDATGAHGAFAVGREMKGAKGLKKVWQRFTGHGSM